MKNNQPHEPSHQKPLLNGREVSVSGELGNSKMTAVL